MLRDRLDDAQMRAAREPQRVAAAAGERQRALRVGALGGQLVGGLRLEHDRRAADRHPEPAEAPRAVAGDREHAQVQARGRLDTNVRITSPTAARTYSIASRSRGPPVLSTSTCSLPSSARMSAASSMRARDARIDASRTAWRARLRPRNSRPVPPSTTTVLTRARCALLVDRLHAHLAPRAGVVQHRALDARRRTGRRVRVAERRLAEQQDVVGHVHDGRPGCAQVAQRPRPPVGLDHDPLRAPLDAHRAAVDAAVRVERRHHGLDDRRAPPTAPPGSARSPSR